MKTLCPITLLGFFAATASALLGPSIIAAQMPGPWDRPASALAEQVAAVLGPGQAHLTVRNLSTIPSAEVPPINRLLEQDLKARGVLTSGMEGANVIQITLSEDARQRLWVAEIVEGTETRVVMVTLPLGSARHGPSTGGLTLRKQVILTTKDQLLAVMETENALLAVEPDRIAIFRRGPDGLKEQKHTSLGQKRPLSRDPRGLILPAANGTGFQIWLPGVECNASFAADQPASDWQIQCHESDDPWPIESGASPAATAAPQPSSQTAPISAFYNAARDYFTGVVSPGVGVDLPPFYSAALIPRTGSSAALLIAGIDGKVQLAENGVLEPVAGARDWGSDFVLLHSGCGAGTQIVASGSGEALTDSLRAYEVLSLEAVSMSAPLAMEGTVTALWSAPDGKSIRAVVRSAADEYEVDRVTALCN